MRCDQCQKFVSFDCDREPEDVDLQVSDDGEVTGTLRIVNVCAECGTELTEVTLEVELILNEQVTEHREEAKEQARKDWDAEQAELPEDEREPFDMETHVAEHDTLTVETYEAVRSDRRQSHDRHGKPIRNPRYQRQYYGADLSVTVACKCGEMFSINDVFETQASSMESLV